MMKCTKNLPFLGILLNSDVHLEWCNMRKI